MLSFDEEEAERLWTEQLTASLNAAGVKCPWCRAEVIRSGGVVGTCPEYPDCMEG